MGSKVGVHSLPGTQGVQFTEGIVDTDESRGIITAYVTNQHIPENRLATLENFNVDGGLFPPDLNGVPLRYVTTKMLEGGHVIATARYQIKGGDRNVKSAWRVKTNIDYGTAYVDVWNSELKHDKFHKDHVGKIAKRRIMATTATITSSGFAHKQFLPGKAEAALPYEMTNNSEDYYIDKSRFPAGSLLMGGTTIRHIKWAAYDRWEWTNIFYYRRVPFTRGGGHFYWAESRIVKGRPRTVDVYPAKPWPNFPL